VKKQTTLFDTVFNKIKWDRNDDFPSCDEWEIEINNWLLFIQSKNQLKRYIQRLNASKTQRDETLAEISSAYVMEVKLKYPVVDWERKTIEGKDVDFVIHNDSDEIYCEVKSPGWESELEQKERLSGRKNLSKYINAEVRSIAPWWAIRYAIKKSYPKFLPNCKNLLIIKDDLFINILDAPTNIDIALFEDSGIYNGEKGYFSNNDFENIGGILIWNCRLTNSKVEYRYKFIVNKNSKKPFSIVIPPTLKLAFPKGWVWTELSNISEIVLGQSPPSSTYNTKRTGLPFYQGKAEFGNLYPTPQKWCSKPKKIAEKGDVLISVRAPVGPTNICPERSCIGRGLAAIRCLDGMQPFFILYLLRAFESKISGKGTGTTFKAITGGQLKNLLIPLPPLPEQQKIVEEIERRFSVADEVEKVVDQSLKQAEWLRQSILKKAFEGKLVPQDPNDPPASILLEQIRAERERQNTSMQPKRNKRKGIKK
jgi:hypothetical protein